MDAAKKYKEQQIRSAKPTELISILYDMCLEACYKKDDKRVVEVLSQLTKALNFDYEISADLFNLYDYCKRAAKQKKFDEVIEIIGGIRNSWNEAVVKKNSAKKQSLNLKG